MDYSVKKNKISSYYAFLGHIYEHYESTLFSFTAAFIGSIFFPKSSDEYSRAFPYICLAAGFITRPLGAIIFSWVGDKYGRRKALIYSITLCIIPSVLISFLPTYAVIGMWSVIILIAARLLQGISIGGGFYATLTFVSESSEDSKKNFLLGVILSMGFLGAILGTLLSSCFMSPHFPSWGWRIPFLIGAFLGLILLVLKKFLAESKVWENAERSTAKIPFLEAVKLYPRNILATLLFGMGILMPFYVAVSWLPGHIMKTFYLSASYNLMLSSGLIFTTGLCVILFAWLLTWISPKRMLLASSIMGLISFPLLLNGLNAQNYFLVVISQFFVAIQTSIQLAASIRLIQNLFPLKYQFSGFAVPFSLGQALVLGSTPLLCEIISFSWMPANVSYVLLIAAALVMTGRWLAQPVRT